MLNQFELLPFTAHPKDALVLAQTTRRTLKKILEPLRSLLAVLAVR